MRFAHPYGSSLLALASALLLVGCVAMPSGPGTMVLPGEGRSFAQFRADQGECRQYASEQLGGSTPDAAAATSAVKSAALGAAIGAAAGAIIGGRQAAASGAGAGLIVGGVAGAGAASHSQRLLQSRYDHAHQQCMYAKGHRIPLAGGFEPRRLDPGYPSRPAAVPPPPPPLR